MEVQILLQEASDKMAQICAHTDTQLKNIQAHKITRESLEGVKVNAYDNLTPLSQIARINVVDTQTLSVEPYDKSFSSAIESAISKQKKDHFIRQNKTGAIFVSLPALTGERRSKLVKEVQQQGEQAKINIRNKRSDIKNELKKLQKDGASEDDVKKAEATLQKTTDEYTKQIEEICKNKEKNLMTV